MSYNPNLSAGQKTMAGSAPVVLPSNQAAIPVNLAQALAETIDSVSVIGTRATYVALGYVSAVAASATDVFTLFGSASKTLIVLEVWWDIFATAAAAQLVTVNKRSTANTGGTSQNLTRVPVDSAQPASAADVVCKSYTVNPTVGTLVGFGGGRKLVAPNKTTPAFQSERGREQFSVPGRAAVVLRGVTEGITLSCEGSISTGLEMTGGFVWIEV